LRLRPILMTSFAFILGCVPLAIASGAGAISRQVMGTTVIFGMTAASFIAIFLIPVTFYVVEKLGHRADKGSHSPPGGHGIGSVSTSTESTSGKEGEPHA
ncbi:MAG: efflux RND transporter permease subunit, partial [Geobacteraceae bacterium]|nr:efflux RND transporter permease subunit [Geobacteraceae bacterium]